ncbi:MAG: transketolase [Sediminibacterium sp. Gen4]|jgi:transketolase|uniref:transketolase n=1 Tax=unclassified Sediminibacterium TaxID=2635961 RepID=UPI0015BA9D68|nr:MULTISPECIES: transketolase [unclassified Sediminibacterium]MBW0161203.1 transketolase [Sediminibacterium sp.]MBW0163729.1 transketolase [Sediminibacterium sp.]NWK66921.1 transketolase [Sediminibacterium sp. Gen4]
MSSSADLAQKIRQHIVRMVHNSGGSHLASALSIVDIVSVLYNEVLKFDSGNHQWSERDRFILSKGHGCTPIYAALAESGFFPVTDLDTYGKNSSILMNHISHKVSGVEFSTGALGHGLPFGVGKAKAAKMSKQSWNTYVVLSDGELDEGSNWEAFMFAAHHKLDNLTAIIDYNKLQSLDTVENTLNLEPLYSKLKSFGWAVYEVDGHDHGQLAKTLPLLNEGKPKVIIAHTTKGKGVSFMEHKVEWHYKTPNVNELADALAEIQQKKSK